MSTVTDTGDDDDDNDDGGDDVRCGTVMMMMITMTVVMMLGVVQPGRASGISVTGNSASFRAALWTNLEKLADNIYTVYSQVHTCHEYTASCAEKKLITFLFLVHGQVTVIFVVSVSFSVCLFVQSFSQPSLIRFRSNIGYMLYVWV